MFTPSMTREEIVAEAKQDFNQLKAFMQVELNAFGRRYNRKYNNSCIMGSIVHTRTFKTRRHNTWTFFLYIRDYAAIMSNWEVSRRPSISFAWVENEK